MTICSENNSNVYNCRDKHISTHDLSFVCQSFTLSSSNSRFAVGGRFVCHCELSKILADHIELHFDVHELLSVVHTNSTSNEFRDYGNIYDEKKKNLFIAQEVRSFLFAVKAIQSGIWLFLWFYVQGIS